MARAMASFAPPGRGRDDQLDGPRTAEPRCAGVHARVSGRCGRREHVVGQVKFALEDLASGADERRAGGPRSRRRAPRPRPRPRSGPAGAVRRPGASRARDRCSPATVPGSANAVATPMAPVTAWEVWHRCGVKYREVTEPAVSPSLTSTGFGTTLPETSPRPIADPAARRRDSSLDRRVGCGVEFLRRLVPADVEVGGPHDHQRHGGVDAGHLDAVDDVDPASGREHRTGDRSPGVEEAQPDRRPGTGHAVDARVPDVRHAPARGLDHGVDPRARVDVEHADRRRSVRSGHQALLDGERPHAREHVPAVRPRVHRALPTPTCANR